jgi:hypothetical protein
MRVDSLVPENPKKQAARASVQANESNEVPNGLQRILSETSELASKLGGALGVLEAENESKVASEKRRAEMFLAELRGVRPDARNAPAGGERAAMELEVANIELNEALRRLAAYEAWEKDLGSLQQLKNHLQAEIANSEQRIAQLTGQPAVRSLRFGVRPLASEKDERPTGLVQSSGGNLDMANLKEIVVRTSEGLTCRMCLSRPVETLSFPCLHVVQCADCAHKSGSSACPVCSGPTTGQLQLKLAELAALPEFLQLAEKISGSAAVMEH